MADKNAATTTAQEFGYGAMLRSLHTGTFREKASPELERVVQHERQFGKPETGEEHAAKFSPRSIFGRANTRVVTVAGAGASLVGTSVGAYLPALQARSLVFRLGARVIPAAKNNVTLPRGATTATTSFQNGETSNIIESENAYGQAGGTPKTLTIFSQVSRQLLLQSNVGEIVSQEQAAAAATAIDASVIGGTGTNGQPLGIIYTPVASGSNPGVASFTGAGLNYAALIAGQQSVSDASAVLDPSALGYLTTPTVAGLLKQRYRATTADAELPIWEGAVAGGSIENVPAFSTKNCPAGSMAFGDFSTIQVFIWDDIRVEVDPYTAFKGANVGIRLTVSYDVVLTYPQSFAVATGIT